MKREGKGKAKTMKKNYVSDTEIKKGIKSSSKSESFWLVGWLVCLFVCFWLFFIVPVLKQEISPSSSSSDFLVTPVLWDTYSYWTSLYLVLEQQQSQNQLKGGTHTLNEFFK